MRLKVISMTPRGRSYPSAGDSQSILTSAITEHARLRGKVFVSETSKERQILIDYNSNRHWEVQCKKRQSEKSRKLTNLLLFWLGFYGISTLIGYLMQNPVHTIIPNTHDV